MEPFPTEEAALKAMAAARRRLPGQTTVEGVMDQYRQHLREKGNRPRSIDTTIGRLEEWMDGDAAIADISARQLGHRHAARYQEVAVDTQRNEVAEVKTFWRWAVKRGYVTRSPAESLEPKGRRRKGKPQLRRGELRELYGAALARARAGDDGALALLLVIVLGLRSSESRCRRVRDVDVDVDGVLLWVDSEGGGADPKSVAGRRHHDVPDPVGSLLARQARGREGTEWLFASAGSSSGHREKRWLLEVARRIAKRAGLDEAVIATLTVQGLRGSWATLTTEAGVAGHVVAKELGHEDFATTRQHYAEPGSTDRAKVKQMFRVLEGGKKKKAVGDD